jgi:hypothetical protein
MVLASHQPTFLPYMGYFYKIFKSDIFVLSDDVPYAKRVFQNYNNIKTPDGVYRITLPITYKTGCSMNEVVCTIPDTILETIKMAYKKSQYFETVFPIVESVLSKKHGNLVQYNIEMITEFIKQFGFDVQVYISSQLNLQQKNKYRIVEMSELLGAKKYYAGLGAKDYLDENLFVDIELEFTDYKPVVYQQLWFEEFIPNLSVLDYVMNCGFKIPKEWQK